MKLLIIQIIEKLAEFEGSFENCSFTHRIIPGLGIEIKIRDKKFVTSSTYDSSYIERSYMIYKANVRLQDPLMSVATYLLSTLLDNPSDRSWEE